MARSSARRTVFAVVLLLVVLVALAGLITLGAIGWAWRHGTLRTSEQERVDMEFERIVRRLDAPFA